MCQILIPSAPDSVRVNQAWEATLTTIPIIAPVSWSGDLEFHEVFQLGHQILAKWTTPGFKTVVARCASDMVTFIVLVREKEANSGDDPQPPPPPPPDIKVRFLDNRDNPIDPNREALSVSNWVTDFGLRNVDFDGELDDPDNIESEAGELNDPDNFRLEVIDPTATEESKVFVEVGVRRSLFAFPLGFYELALKRGDTFRSQLVRLVTDSTDDAVNGKQTILVKLGDRLVLKYTSIKGDIVEEITVGRPTSENDNSDNHRRHDIRELKVKFFVAANSTLTGPVVTKAKVEQDIERANERLAQATIRLKVLKIDMGEDGKGVPEVAFQDGFDKGGVGEFTGDEIALFSRQTDPPESVIVLYVNKMNTPQRGLSYPSQKAIVLERTNIERFTFAHELMHLLLNCCFNRDGSPTHRPGDPPTSLLFAPVSGDQTAVGKRKRIGPNFDTQKAGVGHDDTTTIRTAVKNFPD